MECPSQVSRNRSGMLEPPPSRLEYFAHPRVRAGSGADGEVSVDTPSGSVLAEGERFKTASSVLRRTQPDLLVSKHRIRPRSRHRTRPREPRRESETSHLALGLSPCAGCPCAVATRTAALRAPQRSVRAASDRTPRFRRAARLRRHCCATLSPRTDRGLNKPQRGSWASIKA